MASSFKDLEPSMAKEQNGGNFLANITKNFVSKKQPVFVMAHSNNVQISGLTFEDSPKMHVAFERSTLIYATKLTIRAPEDSPNTDGIHIQHSTNVSIDHSIIQTGDDCISIGDGSKYLNISNINCGPGHRISIGSLGIKGKTEETEFGGHGYARYIKFERIISYGATRPTIVDQYYCPHKHSAAEVSNVAYSYIHGTSHKEIARELACSESTPCKNITMKDINLRNKNEEESTSSYCLNVEGFRNARVNPNVYCLQQDE
ncbi:polygalacturonase-like [Durio zibethinus]|uniref:Polygalacturonase-like n=1 Tax=Durio zibethinus TaxID=66656 RepID=A0A6P5YNJ9_DURZI|nr:polygalacturonase-like [Durio zibethinus]